MSSDSSVKYIYLMLFMFHFPETPDNTIFPLNTIPGPQSFLTYGCYFSPIGQSDKGTVETKEMCRSFQFIFIDFQEYL